MVLFQFTLTLEMVWIGPMTLLPQLMWGSVSLLDQDSSTYLSANLIVMIQINHQMVVRNILQAKQVLVPADYILSTKDVIIFLFTIICDNYLPSALKLNWVTNCHPSKKLATREKLKQTKCLLFNFWTVKLTKTPILLKN